jgi:pyrimidine-nucleoside phosphorylase
MTYLPAELIRKKRFGQAHSRDEIHFLIQGYAQGAIPDYQMSAWLMAICLMGMTHEETSWLTMEMRDSGKALDLSSLGMTVDKHSTGGVGDKVSLILAPLVAAAGVPVPMMAGRGLGHTGGTLDKLESITGFKVDLGYARFHQQLATIGTAIMGQSDEICPADRKLYALRDVTGTIDSLPLICGSIMSKKLAEGASALVLDVKYGSGAFMKNMADGEALAQALVDIGRRAGRKMVALLTRMDEPLGRFIGNALEVQECLDILHNRPCKAQGKSYADTVELTLALAGHMICLGGKAASAEEGYKIATQLLTSGVAGERFADLCRSQGGDLQPPLAKAKLTIPVLSDRSGIMNYINVEKLGTAGVLLGAGRKFQQDVIDHSAGIEVFCQQGDPVQKGDPVFSLFAQNKERLAAALPLVHESFNISTQAVTRSPLIAKVIS